MKKLLLATCLLVSSMSMAQTKSDKKATKPAPAAVTKMEVGGTLNWTGYGVGKTHTGQLQVKSGQVEMKGEELTGGNFVIDMSTLKTGDSPKLEGHLQSADFFDVKKYPEATFKITKVEKIKDAAVGAPNYKLTGDLKIKDKTNKEEFTALVQKADNKVMAKAETDIQDRTKYDIVYNSAKFKSASALGDKLIEDKIKIQMDLVTK